MKLTPSEKASLKIIAGVVERYGVNGTRLSATFIGSRAAAICRRTLEAKGLVSIDRRAVNDFRYSLTAAGADMVRLIRQGVQ